MENSTLLSRGYGFIRFGNQGDAQAALAEMQCVVIGNRPIRLAYATPKGIKNRVIPPVYDPQFLQAFESMSLSGHQGYPNMQSLQGYPLPNPMYPPNSLLSAPLPEAYPVGSTGPQGGVFADPNNTTVFVGGLAPSVSSSELSRYDSLFL